MTADEMPVGEDSASVEPTNVDAAVKPERKPPKAKSKAKAQKLRLDLAASRRRNGVLVRAVAVLCVVCAALAITVGVLAVGRSSAAGDLAEVKQASAQNREKVDAARRTAEDYAKRSLTIDYRQAAKYVDGLRRGTTDAFAKNFSTEQGGAGLLTQELLQQLRMVSEGTVAYTHFIGDADAPPADGQPWNFVVVATQSATTSQQPQRQTSAVVLRVVVVKADGGWKIADFAPDPKVSGGNGTTVPGAR